MDWQKCSGIKRSYLGNTLSCGFQNIERKRNFINRHLKTLSERYRVNSEIRLLIIK